jgi:hypothetical protein
MLRNYLRSRGDPMCLKYDMVNKLNEKGENQ